MGKISSPPYPSRGLLTLSEFITDDGECLGAGVSSEFLSVPFWGAKEAKSNNSVNSRPTFLLDPCADFSVSSIFPRILSGRICQI